MVVTGLARTARRVVKRLSYIAAGNVVTGQGKICGKGYHGTAE
jgi:hypothetical protein